MIKMNAPCSSVWIFGSMPESASVQVQSGQQRRQIATSSSISHDMFSYSWKSALIKTIGHPLGVATGVFAVFATTFAVADWNRENVAIEQYTDSFVHHSSSEECDALEQFHARAVEHRLTYLDILAEKHRTVELLHLATVMEGKFHHLRSSDVTKGVEDADVKNMALSQVELFAQRMSRRALIRNHHVSAWLKTVMEDEFVRVYIVPLATFFVLRYVKKHEPHAGPATKSPTPPGQSSADMSPITTRK